MLFGMLAGLFMLGFLVFVHEFGHFAVAKIFGIGVPVFSIGMGPKAFGFHWRGTEYRFSWLPVGGYVQMAGADPFGDPSDNEWIDPSEDFSKKALWKRLLVMFAGPAVNIALPVVLFTLVFMAGDPQADTVIGAVSSGSVAQRVGLMAGDTVLRVQGQPVVAWNEMTKAIVQGQGQPVRFQVRRDGRTHELVFQPDDLDIMRAGYLDTSAMGFGWRPVSSRVGVDSPSSVAGRAGLKTGDLIETVNGVAIETWPELASFFGEEQLKIGYLRVNDAQEGRVSETGEVLLRLSEEARSADDDPFDNPWGLAPVQLYVGSILSESPAWKSGIRSNDRIYSVNGQTITDWSQITRLVAKSSGVVSEHSQVSPITVEYVRAGVRKSAVIQPTLHRSYGMRGVTYRPRMGVGQYPSAFVYGERVRKYYSFSEALGRSLHETRTLFFAIVDSLSSMLTREAEIGESMGGPVELFRVAAAAAKQGIFSYTKTVGMISISLGVVNLLPIPVLDGGQILFFLVEGVRGRPLSLATREKFQMAGVLGLVALMLVVTVTDIEEWVRSWRN